MKSFIERLQLEQVELEERLIKLCNFLDSNKSEELGSRDFELLVKQKNVMTDYNSILKDRLYLLGV